MKTTRPEIEKRFAGSAADAARAVASLSEMIPQISDAAQLVLDTLAGGRKVLTIGNGGSAAEAMHAAEELSGRFRANRKALPGIALVSDGTALTCISNDFGYDCVFSRQVEAIGGEGDLLIIFSSSGNGACLSNALEAAHAAGMRTLALLGKTGGAIAGKSTREIIVKCDKTEHVQECHQVILHMLLDAVEMEYAEK